MAELDADGVVLPVLVHVIEHPEGRVLVDTGLTEVHPLVADMSPRMEPSTEPRWEPSAELGAIDPAGVDLVVNTHLHFDHCGGNHRYAGIPVHVQRRELRDARG